MSFQKGRIRLTENTNKTLLKRVVTKPGVYGCEPCIRGTRINVAVILDSLAEGLSPDQIVEHLPSLTRQDVWAAVAYAAALPRPWRQHEN